MLRTWVRLPTNWISERLKDLSWRSYGSDGIAALMTLIAIAHHADDETGIARLTYDDIQKITTLSRTKISNGLDILNELDILDSSSGQSTYGLAEYDPTRGWGKLPAKKLYSGGRIVAFDDFNLRKRVELDALKLYLLFIARRDNDRNFAQISYDRIEVYVDIDRGLIKRAISFLASLGLVHIEHLPSGVNEYGVSNAYRVAHIEQYVHMGTRGRNSGAYD